MGPGKNPPLGWGPWVLFAESHLSWDDCLLEFVFPTQSVPIPNDSTTGWPFCRVFVLKLRHQTRYIHGREMERGSLSPSQSPLAPPPSSDSIHCPLSQTHLLRCLIKANLIWGASRVRLARPLDHLPLHPPHSLHVLSVHTPSRLLEAQSEPWNLSAP